MLAWYRCACHIWPIVVGYKIGRCKRCRETPVQIVTNLHAAVCLHEGPCQP